MSPLQATVFVEINRHYTAFPPSDEAEEFQALFGRKGEGVVEELKKYLTTLDGIKTSDTMFRFYFNRIQGPQEILSQTHTTEDESFFPWNEINLDLRAYPGLPKESVKVKAILIDQETLYSVQNKSEEERKLLKIINEAQDRRIPVLIRG